jgi:hypothetical protein
MSMAFNWPFESQFAHFLIRQGIEGVGRRHICLSCFRVRASSASRWNDHCHRLLAARDHHLFAALRFLG